MSLINDLVIEVDRGRGEDPGLGAGPTPRLTPPGLVRRPRDLRGLAWALIAASTLLVALGALRALAPGILAGEHEPAATPPAVSAAAPLAETVAIRPSSIRRLDVERTGDEVVVRVEIDGPAAYRAEPSDGGRRLDVTIDAASQEDLTRGLDLAGTPIRSVRALGLAGETTLAFEFDAPESVERRWREDGSGAVLELSIDTTRGAWTSPRRDEVAKAPETGESWYDWPAIEPTPAPGRAAPSTAASAARGSGLATAGDEVRIMRSSNDRARRDREEQLRRAEALIEEARIARAEGRLEEAAQRFEQALVAAPDHRRALIEAGVLSLELGRPEEAINRIREARKRAPRDADLAMVHARLVASTGELAQAIQILERSAQTLTEAPEVHALAAALLHQSGDHARAIDRYETLLRRYPGEARWWMGLGISFEAVGRDDEALDVYRIASQLGALPVNSRRWVASRIESLDGED